MELYYWKVTPSNFGDELNPWLWNQLIPEELNAFNDEVLFLGIGTLLNHKLPLRKKKIVFGSGVGYGDKPKLNDSYSIYFVRGPLSADILKLDNNKYITDPAILISLYENSLKRKILKKYPISFVPHYETYMFGDWDIVCKRCGIHCISPFSNVEDIMVDILSSDLIIADAMHGAILSDTFRIPWIPVHSSYGHINSFKWQDWTKSMFIPYKPSYIDAIWRGDRHQSIERRFKNKIKRVFRRVGIYRKNWGLPDKPRSNSELHDKVAKQLFDLSKGLEPILSKENIFKNKLSDCIEKLSQLKRNIKESRFEF